jgi:CRP/FNR family transcriptional regulator
METNKLWYLKRINLFHCLSSEELDRLGELAQHRSYQRRQIIFDPQERGAAIYLLKQGRVKLSRFDERGKELTLAILEEGEFFGEEALLGEERRLGYAEALDDVKLCRVPVGEFERLMGENSELSMAVSKQLGGRLLGAQTQFETLAFRDVTERLAAALVQLAERNGSQEENGGIRIDLQLTHQEIASLVASTRETTTTLLGKLKRDGLIRAAGRFLVVQDLEALRALSRGR